MAANAVRSAPHRAAGKEDTPRPAERTPMRPSFSPPRAVRARGGRRLLPLARPDAAEGADLLPELAGPAGVLLWGALRDFLLWVETPARARAALFAPGAGDVRRRELAAFAPEQALWAPLLTLAQMADAPGRAEAPRLVFAVRSIARWAEHAGAPATQLAFTRAAALALPQDATLALETGRLARDLARHAQAEVWFRRAIRLARGRDWEAYGWGFIGLGVQYVRAGNYPAAQTVFGRALRSARKRRLRGVEASSLHHLFTCAAEGRDLREAYAHADAALAAYGPAHPRIPALANDLARLWMHLGRFERALPVFEALAPLITYEPEAMIGHANLARAAAACGARGRYERARACTLELIAATAAGTRVAEAWSMVASADAEAGEWVRMADAAARAVELATARGEAEALVMAEVQLQAARERVASRADHWAEEPACAADAGRLAGELLARIRELEPAGA